jgi:hypothetical protein
MRLEHGRNPSAQREPARQPGLRRVEMDDVRLRVPQDPAEPNGLRQGREPGVPTCLPRHELGARAGEIPREVAVGRGRDRHAPAAREAVPGKAGGVAGHTSVAGRRHVEDVSAHARVPVRRAFIVAA